ncbi:MAG: ABC transporter permease [Chloroflexia bacterium]|nr:ABC transporter permease [Chloroflexia bacterium]
MSARSPESQTTPATRTWRAVPWAWLLGISVVVGRRLWSNLALILAIATGFTIAVAIVVCIPVYAEAVGYRILREELTSTVNGTKRPPFAFMYRYLGTQSGNLEPAKLDAINTYFADQLPARLGLKITNQTRYFATDRVPLRLEAGGGGTPLSWVSISYADHLADHVDVIDGRMPQATAVDEPMEVLLSADFAFGLGLQPGDTYYIFTQREFPAKSMIPVKITGIWQPKDANDDYWFYAPDVLHETLFTAEESFARQLLRSTPKPINVALWYVVADGSVLRSNDVPVFGGRIDRTVAEANKILKGMRLDVSPIDALIRHITRVRQLTGTLTIFSIPVLGLIAYFVVLVAGLVVQRQSNEIAVLRSRGASRLQVLGIYLIEWLLIGMLAISIGVFVGQLAAVAMTWTRSFLDFKPIKEFLPIGMSQDAWGRAIEIVGLMLLAALIPAFFTSKFTIVSFKSERARSTLKPFWQRAYLDILLMIPIGYGWWMLKQQGSLGIIGGDGTNDPFNNPLLLIAPSLFIFAAALIAVRLFPMIMQLLEFVMRYLPGISGITALRYLARTPSAYSGPILLLIVTLSLAGFTASMAKSLDNNLLDRNHYVAGGDLLMFDMGQDTSGGNPAAPGSIPTGVGAPTEDKRLAGPKYFFLPVTDYQNMPQVTNATRVANSKVTVVIGGKTSDAHYFGIDRLEFPSVTFWRTDFARQPLGALMNLLAEDPSAVLVDRKYAGTQNLRIGDSFIIQMNNLDSTVNVPVIVKGYIDMFPTAYPSEGPAIIGNLEYSFDMQGGQYPYDVWIRLIPESTVSDADLYRSSIEMGMKTFIREFAPAVITKERLRPERQGFFGLLSVGFIAAAFLSMLGFLFYSILAFQRRFVELGMLRAIGLSTGQLGTLLAIEQTFIIGIAGIAGTFIGVSASNLFIPFLQLPQQEKDFFPPFAVQIASEQILIIYAVFGFVLVATVAITVILLRRMKLFQAVKLGEAI